MSCEIAVWKAMMVGGGVSRLVSVPGHARCWTERGFLCQLPRGSLAPVRTRKMTKALLAKPSLSGKCEWMTQKHS